jgi:cyclopropane-fatty-acyl-phospholipid synthase
MRDDIIPAALAEDVCRAPASPGRLQRFARRLLLSRMARLEHGLLEVHDAEGTERFGQARDGGLRARIEVLHPQFWADAVFGGTATAGEAYIHGLWKCDDLTALVRIMVANRHVLEDVDGRATRLADLGRRVGH